jgi:hypothetical protein
MGGIPTKGRFAQRKKRFMSLLSVAVALGGARQAGWELQLVDPNFKVWYPDTTNHIILYTLSNWL